MGRSGQTVRFWVITGSALALLFVVAGFAAARFGLQAQVEHHADRLLLLSSLRKEALEAYFDTARAEITFWSLNQDLLAKQAEMVRRWELYRDTAVDPGTRLQQLYLRANPYPEGERRNLNDAGDGSAYSEMHAALHPMAKLFVIERGYYDFFLIGPNGDIFYTVEKEADFGTNLITGPWRDTGLAGVFKRALANADSGAVVFSDFASYGPSAGAPAMFMARAMSDSAGKVIGVLAMQLPTDTINSIMRFDAGMGETGETYLVGEDLLMRSDSRFVDTSTILQVKVDTKPARRALAGESAAFLSPDYRGVRVLSAFNAIAIDQFRWAVMAEIDEQEILQTVANRRPLIGGAMFLLYSLAMWSLWYVRQADWSQGEGLSALAVEPDHSDVGGVG
jgi:methyl-accepting chemotaxis protein